MANTFETNQPSGFDVEASIAEMRLQLLLIKNPVPAAKKNVKKIKLAPAGMAAPKYTERVSSGFAFGLRCH